MPSATQGNPKQKKAPVKLGADDLDVLPRMYKQMSRLLDQLEKQDILDKDGVTVPQRIASLIACGRIMKMFQDIKRGNLDAGAGSAVNKYSAAFQTTDAVGRPKRDAGPAYAGQSDPDSGDDGDDWDDAA